MDKNLYQKKKKKIDGAEVKDRRRKKFGTEGNTCDFTKSSFPLPQKKFKEFLVHF